MKLTDAQVKLLIEGLQFLIELAIKNSNITPEDKVKVLDMKERLSELESKWQRIADGSDV